MGLRDGMSGTLINLTFVTFVLLNNDIEVADEYCIQYEYCYVCLKVYRDFQDEYGPLSVSYVRKCLFPLL